MGDLQIPETLKILTLNKALYEELLIYLHYILSMWYDIVTRLLCHGGVFDVRRLFWHQLAACPGIRDE
jgi:hypothetical protein